MGTARALWLSVRPRQWMKNAACLAGVLFSGKALDPEAEIAAWSSFLVFCAAASAMYLLNDVRDREEDRAHPRKRSRPIASGELSAGAAVLAALVLLVGAAAGAVWLGKIFAIALGSYVALGVLYTRLLKRVFLIDVLAIASGFVIRVWAGIAAIGEVPSEWILLCTLFLALFLALAKRRGELAAVRRAADPTPPSEAAEGLRRTGSEDADAPTAESTDARPASRPVLAHYRLEFLDQMLTLAATGAVISYALFTVLRHPELGPALVATILPVVYGIGRYYHLVTTRGEGESPERILVSDIPLLVTVAVWALLYAGLLYFLAPVSGAAPDAFIPPPVVPLP